GGGLGWGGVGEGGGIGEGGDRGAELAMLVIEPVEHRAGSRQLIADVDHLEAQPDLNQAEEHQNDAEAGDAACDAASHHTHQAPRVGARAHERPANRQDAWSRREYSEGGGAHLSSDGPPARPLASDGPAARPGAGSLAAVPMRSTMRSRALRARGLAAISSAVGLSGRAVSTRAVAVQPQVQTGSPGGHRHDAAHRRNASFTR